MRLSAQETIFEHVVGNEFCQQELLDLFDDYKKLKHEKSTHIELTKKTTEEKILVRVEAIDQVSDTSFIAMYAGSFQAKESYEEIKRLIGA